VFEDPAPRVLPTTAEIETRWHSRLVGRVLSASDRPIDGERIRSEWANRFEGDDRWRLVFSYNRPESQWQKYEDDRGGTQSIPIERVATDGTIWFKNADGAESPMCTYNHWKLFYNIKKMQLGARGCTVNAAFHAGDVRYWAGDIDITPEKTRRVTVKLWSLCGKELPNSVVVLGPTWSPMLYRATTDATGEAAFEISEDDCHQPEFVVSGRYRARINLAPIAEFFTDNMKAYWRGSPADGSARIMVSESEQKIEITLPCSRTWAITGLVGMGATGPPYVSGGEKGSVTYGATVTAQLFHLKEMVTRKERYLGCRGLGAGASLNLVKVEAMIQKLLDLHPRISKPDYTEFQTEMPVVFDDFLGLGWIYSIDLPIYQLSLVGFAWIHMSPIFSHGFVGQLTAGTQLVAVYWNSFVEPFAPSQPQIELPGD
jgi:hypothetical protein